MYAINIFNNLGKVDSAISCEIGTMFPRLQKSISTGRIFKFMVVSLIKTLKLIKHIYSLFLTKFS